MNIFIFILITNLFDGAVNIGNVRKDEPRSANDINNNSFWETVIIRIGQKYKPIAAKIIRGDNMGGLADRKQFCYQASISLSKPDDQLHICGAVIIDKGHVLTAAHCLVSLHKSNVTILAGHVNLTDGTEIQEKNASKFFIHKNFIRLTESVNESVWANDIAVIELESEFSLDENTCTIEIAESDPKTRIDCQISGWGIYNQEEELISEVLRFATIPIISDSECREMHKDLIREGNFCAGFIDGRGDACQGDSGGPLVCQNELVGLISWGPKNCTMPRFSGVYVNVTFYKDWIFSLINKTITVNVGNEPTYEQGLQKNITGIIGNDQEYEEISPKIITGENVDESNRKNFCHQASISNSKPDDQMHFCGAVIIHKRYVLTAAHCLVSKEQSSITILAGLLNLTAETGIQEKRAAKFFKHENLTEVVENGNSTVWANDIALIELESEFSLDENTCIIKIAESDPKTRTDCQISGWGIYNQDEQLNSEVLRFATIPIISDGECREMYKDLIREGNFCAGFTDGRGDACQGDSGGPLVCQNELVGLISWGPENCTMPRYSGVYVNVTFYNDWIKSYTESASDPKVDTHLLLICFTLLHIYIICLK